MSLELEPEELNLVSLIIGMIVIAWGQVEATMNLAVNMLHDTYGDKAKDITPDRAFSRRIKFLRRASKDYLPAELHQPLADLLSEAKRISDVRDMLVHGYASNFDRTTGVLTFDRFDPKQGGHLPVQARYDVRWLHRLADETIKLAGDIARLNNLILPHFVKDAAD